MSQGGPSSASGSGAPPIETLTGNSGGAVGPDGSFNIDILGNNTTGIDIVGTPASNLLTVVGLPASDTQIGTVELATAVETGTLTDNTLAISPSSLEPILISGFVVASGGAYTTIQSALDAANSAGGGVVYVRPGTYVEDLILYDATQIVGAQGEADSQDIIIQGSHTPPSTGTFSFTDVKLVDAAAIVSSAVAGSAQLSFNRCVFDVTNGYILNCDNWTGEFRFDDCGTESTDDGIINNSGAATVFTNNSLLGAGSGNTFTANGSLRFDLTQIACPYNFSCTGLIEFNLVFLTAAGTLGSSGIYLITFGSGIFGTLTVSDTATVLMDNCQFNTQASTSLIYNSTSAGSVSRSTFDSSNGTVIGGTGSLLLNNLSFVDQSTIAGTITQLTSDYYPSKMDNGQLLIGNSGAVPTVATLTAGSNISISNGAGTITINANGGGVLDITSLTDLDSPYTVLSTDEYLSCDVSAGVLTIKLPDAPTTGRVIRVKDSLGAAAGFNITVTTVGGVVLIDGGTSFVMNTAYEAANFIFNGTSYEVF